jgi:hypothetical protein
MDVTFKGLLQLARDTVQDPRDGARQIMALNAPMQRALDGADADGGGRPS